MKIHTYAWWGPASEAKGRTKTRLALYVMLLASITGCEPMTPEQAAQQKLESPFKSISVHHDDARSVTCWIPHDSRAGLSCLPDWMLGGGAVTQRQHSPHEHDNTPTPAMAPAHWNEERYSL